MILGVAVVAPRMAHECVHVAELGGDGLGVHRRIGPAIGKLGLCERFERERAKARGGGGERRSGVALAEERRDGGGLLLLGAVRAEQLAEAAEEAAAIGWRADQGGKGPSGCGNQHACSLVVKAPFG